ncbi:MAG TPA: sodium/proline symporter [Bacillota bacterium]
MTFETILLAMLVVYFTLCFLEGVRSMRLTKDETDYLVAGRKLGPWIGGATFSATQMSAGTFVGTIAVHYLTGSSFIWAWAGIWTAYMVGLLWIAPRLRRYSLETGALTFPDFVADRFGSKWARAVAAGLPVIAYIVYMSAQYQAGGVIIQTLFGLPFLYGALILAVITVIYTAVGGMIAVVNTDFLQQCMMALGAVVGVPLAIYYAGGLSNLPTAFAAISTSFAGWSYGFRDLLGFAVAFGLTFVSAPYVLTRFYALRDEKATYRAVAVALFFNVVIAGAVAILGMALRVTWPQLLVADSASSIFASQVLPPIIGAIVMTAVIAAIMSTNDSVLLAAGPAIAHDIYYRLINPKADERQVLRWNRWSTVIIGFIPILIALRQLDIVQFIVLAYSAILGSTVFVPVVVGLYWRRATSAGTIAAMAVGLAVCLIWYAIGQPVIHPSIAGGLSSLIAMVAVSLITPPAPDENLRMFFRDTTAEGGASVSGD